MTCGKFSLIIIYSDNNFSGFPETGFNHMDRERKKYLRGILFRHLDGIALSSTISALHKKNIIQYITDHPAFTIQQLLNEFECNAGYFNVSLRLLASQGWLERNIIHDGENIEFQLTEKGQECFSLAHHYDSFCQFIPILINLDRYLFDSNTKSIQDELQNIFEHLLDQKDCIFKDPLIHCPPNYKTTLSLEALVAGEADISIDKGLSKLPEDEFDPTRPLYTHQIEAIRILGRKENLVVEHFCKYILLISLIHL